MAYYPDGSMADWRLSKTQNLCALGQIPDGLKHLHRHGEVHRDLKPENILVKLQPDFQIAISDFGLSKIVTEGSLLTLTVGTPMYMALEVFQSGSSYGPEVDIWSLGVMGFQALYQLPKPSWDYPADPEAKLPWAEEWTEAISVAANKEEMETVLSILYNLIAVLSRRWSADRCLAEGFRVEVFARRQSDGCVVNNESNSNVAGSTDAADSSDATASQVGEDRTPGASVISSMSSASPVKQGPFQSSHQYQGSHQSQSSYRSLRNLRSQAGSQSRGSYQPRDAEQPRVHHEPGGTEQSRGAEKYRGIEQSRGTEQCSGTENLPSGDRKKARKQ